MLLGGQAGLDGGGKGLAVHTALVGGHDGGDDLAHRAGRGGAHFGDGGIDEGGQLFFAQGLGQVALDDGQFGGFLVGQILTAGGGWPTISVYGYQRPAVLKFYEA